MKNTIVATATFYTSVKEARFQCAERLVRNCVLLYGIPIYVVDGSGPEVNERLRLAGSILEHQSDPGMGPGRRQLFASVENHLAQRGENPEKTYVCWTEPEKDTFAEFIPTLIEGLVIISRISVIQNDTRIIITDRINIADIARTDIQP